MRTIRELTLQADVARTYVQGVASRVENGEPLVSEVAMAKNTTVDAYDFVVDAAVQLHRASVTCATPRCNGITGTRGSWASAGARQRS